MKKLVSVVGLLLCLVLALGIWGCESMTETDTGAAQAVTTAATSPAGDGVAATTGSRWTQLRTTGQLPPARTFSSMVYDPSGDRVIIFGGGGESWDFDDTWAYDPAKGRWTDLAPAGEVPSAREQSPLVYDPVSHDLFLFGGWDLAAQHDLADTWTYDTEDNVWTELEPAGKGPSARDGHSLVYDPESKTLLLFGGSDEEGAELNDTWAYDPHAHTWTELEPSGELPSARAWHSAAYDAENHQMIVFGGAYGEEGDEDTLLNDTWAYNPASNAWADLAPEGDLPARRYHPAMAYDADAHTVIVYGGGTKSGSLRDTWVYDPASNTWTDRAHEGSLPPMGLGQAMVYDPAGDRVLVFGGWSIADWEATNQVWACKPVSEPSTLGSGSSLAPPPRLAHSLVYDPVKGQVILFGGSSFSGEETPLVDNDDTWVYDAKSIKWTELHPSGDLPSGRSGHAMVYDPAGKQVIMFGGASEASGFGDTWSYDPAADSWTELAPAGKVPAARDGHSLVYDPKSGKVFLFGGEDGSTELKDTWAYDAKANEWTELHPRGGQPRARCYHTMVYDPIGERVILFGGSVLSGEEEGEAAVGIDDAWAYDPQANTWTELAPPRDSPSARLFPGATYNPADGRVILFGGYDDSSGEDLNDTWRYDPATNAWAEFAPEKAVPPARDYHALVYDSLRDKVILFGGWGPEAGLFNDIWEYDPDANTWIELLPSTDDVKETLLVVSALA